MFTLDCTTIIFCLLSSCQKLPISSPLGLTLTILVLYHCSHVLHGLLSKPKCSHFQLILMSTCLQMFDNLVQSEQNSDLCAVYKRRGMGPQISSTGAGHHSLPQRRLLPVHALRKSMKVGCFTKWLLTCCLLCWLFN